LFLYTENLYIDGVLTTEIYIPDGTIEINRFTFYQCDFLTAIHIPKTVRELYSHCIYLCGDLTIYYEGTVDEWHRFYGDIEYWYYENNDHYTVICADGEITL
jgi:hypothetical protein